MDMKECPFKKCVTQEMPRRRALVGQGHMGAQKQCKRDRALFLAQGYCYPEYETVGGKLHGRRERKSQRVVELTGT